MNILVCGGRDYDNQNFIFAKLDEFSRKNDVRILIHGAATGADSIAHAWALNNGVQTAVCRPNWERFGRKAGIMRNLAMLDLDPDVVMAFPGGDGTAHMIYAATKAGKEVIDFDKEIKIP